MYGIRTTDARKLLAYVSHERNKCKKNRFSICFRFHSRVPAKKKERMKSTGLNNKKKLTFI